MTRQRPEASRPEVELPITPMLDMTFQLLTFFLITYQPVSTVEAPLDFTLPAVAAGNTDTVPADPTASELEVPATVVVVARASQGGDGAGGISDLSVRTPGGEHSVHSPLALRQHLERMLQKGDVRSTEIKLQADAALRYAFVVQVMDACRQSGFEQIGLAAPEAPAADK